MNIGLNEALEAVKALRSENGCPWDKEQTHRSLRKYLLEETYEVLEAIDLLDEKKSNTVLAFKEELGDLLFQVILHAQLAEEKSLFSFDEIAKDLSKKLIHRHPHVFSGKEIASTEEVIKEWEKNKKIEKKRDSALDELPPLPALQKALKIIERVSSVGFQWPNLEGPWQKIQEELGELHIEIQKICPLKNWDKKTKISEEAKKRVEAEMGDLLFCIVNISYFLKINPEDSLRSMLGRFEKRFRFIENKAKENGKKLEELSLGEMDIYWSEAKKILE